MTKLVVIGGIALDYLSKVKDVNADVTQVQEYSENMGGMAYNTAITTSQLGIITRLVAPVGRDFPHMKSAKKLIMDFHPTNGMTTRSFLFFDDNKEKIYFYPGAYHDFNVEKAKNAIEKSDWVHFAGVVPCFADLIDFADEEEKVVSTNVGYDMFHYDPADRVIKQLIKKSDYLILSSSEAKHLNRPIDSIVNAAAIVTMGKNGSIVVEKGNRTQIDTHPVDVQSPFGAGDCYTGTFIASMIKENDVITSARLASAAGSFAVEERTTTPKLEWDDIEKRAKKL